MLSPNKPVPLLLERRFGQPVLQRGVVLMISLIILVALTIGGIALFRSVGTTNIIAGNLAFQQAATFSGEAGSEAAIRSIEEGNLTAMSFTALQSNNFARGYTASTPSGVWLNTASTAGTPNNWDKYWAEVIDPVPKTLPVAAGDAGCGHGGGRVCTLATDAIGNTVSYTIQRLCQTAGDPVYLPTGCAGAPKELAPSGSSKGSGSIPVYQVQKYYYRITSRTVGPRNTISYVQTIVAR
jgi:type IV pilus assembly protein PilX